MIWFWVAVGEILSGFVRDDDGIGFYGCGELVCCCGFWICCLVLVCLLPCDGESGDMLLWGLVCLLLYGEGKWWGKW